MSRWTRSIRQIASRAGSSALFASLLGAVALPAQQGHYSNPVMPGDWSDPGVVEVDGTYYSVRSTFGWQPGLLIASSQDLVNWNYAGRIEFENVPAFRNGETAWGAWGSELIWNPNTRKFLVHAPLRETDEIVAWQADTPAGPWDGPYHIAFAIDPGIFVDDVPDADGNYPLYVSFAAEGAIYELTPDGLAIRDFGKLYGPRITGYTVGAEGPEIVKRDGWYYFIYSTGGTLPWEAYNIQTARTRDLRDGPWEFDPANPQLLANSYTYAPLQGPGHGELLQMPDGSWFLTHHVFEITHYSLGRQKAMTPVEWTADGWWRPRYGQIPPPSAARPALRWVPQQPQGSDEFEYSANREIGWQWFWNHQPSYDGSYWSVVERPGWLRLKTQSGDISSAESRPNVFLQRVQHKRFEVQTRLDFDAQQDGEAAGLHFYHDPRQSFWLVSTAENGRKRFEVGRYWWDADAQLARRESLASVPNRWGHDVQLMIRVDGEESATFWVRAGEAEWEPVGGSVYFGDSGRDRRDGRAGKPDLGWVGQWTRGNNRWTAATFGVFAVRDGAPQSRPADFEYVRVTSFPYINHPRPVPGEASAPAAFRFGLGDPVSIPLSVHGGTPPYRWSAAGLPAGIAIDPTTGRIRSAGPQLAAGTHAFEVTVTDAAGGADQRTISLQVGPPVSRLVDCSREHRHATSLAELPTSMRAALEELVGAERLDEGETRLARITTCGAYHEVPYTVFEMSGATPTRTFMLRALEDGTLIDHQTKPRTAPSVPVDVASMLQDILHRELGERFELRGTSRVETASGQAAYRLATRNIGRIYRLIVADDGEVLERWARHSLFDLPPGMRERIDGEVAGRTNPWLEIWRGESPHLTAFQVEIRDTERAELVQMRFEQSGELTARTVTQAPTS